MSVPKDEVSTVPPDIVHLSDWWGYLFALPADHRLCFSGNKTYDFLYCSSLPWFQKMLSHTVSACPVLFWKAGWHHSARPSLLFVSSCWLFDNFATFHWNSKHYVKCQTHISVACPLSIHATLFQLLLCALYPSAPVQLCFLFYSIHLLPAAEGRINSNSTGAFACKRSLVPLLPTVLPINHCVLKIHHKLHRNPAISRQSQIRSDTASQDEKEYDKIVPLPSLCPFSPRTKQSIPEDAFPRNAKRLSEIYHFHCRNSSAPAHHTIFSPLGPNPLLFASSIWLPFPLEIVYIIRLFSDNAPNPVSIGNKLLHPIFHMSPIFFSLNISIHTLPSSR